MSFADSVIQYRTIRNIFIDGESNSIQIGLETDMSDEEVEQAVLRAVDKNYLKMVKDSNPEEYSVNLDKLVEEWYKLWELETGKSPATPENFDSFLENYIKSYLKNEKHSTIKEMLVNDFYTGLNQQASQSYIGNDFRELSERLGQNFEGKKSLGEHVKHGFDNR